MHSLMTWTPRTLATDTSLDRFFGDFFQPSSGVSRGFTPAVDIVERKDHYLLSLDLPGFKREDLQVTVEEGTLLVSGKRQTSHESDEGSLVRSERTTGEFSRSFRLGDAIDADAIAARYENGVLEVRVAKAEAAKPRQITVK